MNNNTHSLTRRYAINATIPLVHVLPILPFSFLIYHSLLLFLIFILLKKKKKFACSIPELKPDPAEQKFVRTYSLSNLSPVKYE